MTHVLSIFNFYLLQFIAVFILLSTHASCLDKEQLIESLERQLRQWNPSQIDTLLTFEEGSIQMSSKLKGDSVLLIDEQGSPLLNSMGYVIAQNDKYCFKLGRKSTAAPWAITSFYEGSTYEISEIGSFKTNVGVLPVSVGGHLDVLLLLKADFVHATQTNESLPIPFEDGIAPDFFYSFAPDKETWVKKRNAGETKLNSLFDHAFVGFRKEDSMPVYLNTQYSNRDGKVFENIFCVTNVAEENNKFYPSRVKYTIDGHQEEMEHTVQFGLVHNDEIFKLEGYGLLEPSLGNSKSTNIYFWSICAFAAFVAFIGVFLRQKSKAV